MMKTSRWITALLLVTLLVIGMVPFGRAAAADTAQVRLAHFVFDGAPSDVYIDGKLAENNVISGSVTGYLALAAGAHQLTVVPTGQDMSMAMADAQPFSMEAGRNYAVALVGQAADKSIKPLVIDETAALQGQDTVNQGAIITVHNIKGAPTLAMSLDTTLVNGNIAYGSYGVGMVKSGNYNLINITAAEDAKTTFSPPLPPGAVFIEPGVVILVGLMGTVPGDFGATYTMVYQPSTTLTVSQFLAGFSGRGIGYPKSLTGIVPFKPQVYSFDTLLAALTKAGLKDRIDQGSYILFAPTDEAFAALPAGTLDKLMADPKALTDLLSYHIAQGTLSGAELAKGKTLDTLKSGATLQVISVEDPDHAGFEINGNGAGCGCNYWTANGNRIFVLDTVLTPPTP